MRINKMHHQLLDAQTKAENATIKLDMVQFFKQKYNRKYIENNFILTDMFAVFLVALNYKLAK